MWNNWCRHFSSLTFSTVPVPQHLAIAELQKHSISLLFSQSSCTDNFNPSDFLLERNDGFWIFLILAIFISVPKTYIHSHT